LSHQAYTCFILYVENDGADRREAQNGKTILIQRSVIQ
jgi:hypothetical protein